MTADEAHADLQAALAEEDENRTESIRTMALVVIALELQREREQAFPRCISATGGHRFNPPDSNGLQECRTCGILRPLDVHTPNNLPVEVYHLDIYGPKPKPPERGDLAGLETHGKQERERGR